MPTLAHIRALLSLAAVCCALAAIAGVALAGDPPVPIPIDPPGVPPVNPPLPPGPGGGSGGGTPEPKAGCNRYASPRGSDRARGTIGRPFRTVRRLNQALRPGMQGCLRRGVYRDDVKISRGGRRGAPVVIRPYQGERARIIGRFWVARSADDVRIEGLYLDGRNARRLPSPTVNAARASFVGNDVTNHHSAICFGLGTVQYGRAISTVIRGNRVHDCGRLPRTNHDHGIYVEQASGTVIEDNWIYRNADRGVQLYPNAQNTIIRRNVIHGNATGIVFSGAFGEASSGALVEQNVLTGSAERYNVESYWPDPARVGHDNVVRSNCLMAGVRGRRSGGLQLPAIGFEVGPNIIERLRYAAPRRGDFRIRGGGACAAMLGSPQPLPGPRAR
jgi:parallel beta-helix repeat protein